MQWLSSTCSVSYYEPLSLWTIKLAEPPANEGGKLKSVEDWEPQAYTTNFIVTDKSGMEVGLATLEYTPPMTRTVKQIVELEFFDEPGFGGKPNTQVETSKQIMF